MATQQDSKAILFDFDGVLAKTMEDNFAAWENATAEFGIEISPDDYFPIEGMSVVEVAKKFCRMANISEEYFSEILKRKEEYYLKNHTFELYSNVREFIDLLKEKKIPIGVVTSALYNRLINSVPSDFLKKFDTIVTGNKTEKGKPFPDPYLYGAKELGIDIKKCLVIENAPLGIQAAKSAGAYCIAICSTLAKDKLLEADEVINEFKDLKELAIIKTLLNQISTIDI